MILWLLPPPFIKVCSMNTGGEHELIQLGSVELHGSEDGSVPATFQIIYMVCISNALYCLWILICHRSAGNPRLPNPNPLNEALERSISRKCSNHFFRRSHVAEWCDQHTLDANRSAFASQLAARSNLSRRLRLVWALGPGMVLFQSRSPFTIC